MPGASGAGVLGTLIEDVVLDYEYVLPAGVVMSKVFDLRGVQATAILAGLADDGSTITGVYAGNEADGSDMVKCEGVENIAPAAGGGPALRVIDIAQLRAQYMQLEINTNANPVSLTVIGYRVRQAPVPATRHDSEVVPTTSACLCAPAEAAS